MAKVTICIPTYFGNTMLQNCVASIFEHAPNSQILIYKNDKGWLQACNEMMSNVTGDVILLNDDTSVISNIVYKLQAAAYSDPKIGIVGGKALSTNQDMIVNYGIWVGTDGNTAHRHFGQNRDAVGRGLETQRAVEGSCMYIKRELIDEIGLFEEQYTMGYRAEVSYCFKAREAGWKVVSTPYAEYVHFISQTSGPLGIKNDTHDIFMEQWGQKLALGKV